MTMMVVVVVVVMDVHRDSGVTITEKKEIR